ncbi:hypothetical protein V2J09_007096 [Rumex salicifolius]
MEDVTRRSSNIKLTRTEARTKSGYWRWKQTLFWSHRWATKEPLEDMATDVIEETDLGRRVAEY